MVLLRRRFGVQCGVFAALLFLLAWMREAAALRPLRNRNPSPSASWTDERIFLRSGGNDPTLFSGWNITGTYRGTWSFRGESNRSSKFLNFGVSNGMSVLQLASIPTKINGVHYIQGAVFFHDGYENDVGIAQMQVEGVYIWPFKQLRLVVSRGSDRELLHAEHYLSNPYHLLEAFSSQVFQDSTRDQAQRKNSLTYDIEKQCNIEISAQISQVTSSQADGEHYCYHLEGLMESPAVEDDGECFSSIQLNATSLNVEIFYSKAVNYTLMVTFISFLQVVLVIRQMEHSNTQSGAAKISILMIGQQAIMDAYLCLLHLTAGILVESLFNAFATAAFFKFVVFSIFEMRYLLSIWKANRPLSNGEGWEAMRRELSVLYGRFYGILLGGILVMYELHRFLRPVLFIMYSFWIPQIVYNVIRDTRKPLHPYYIFGMSLTRLAIPLYIFGCPRNFLRIEVDRGWCISLCLFVGFQAIILLLQHYLGSRWFIPHQILPEKYSYNRRQGSNFSHSTECVICMTAIDMTLQSSTDYMVTPCDHLFHSYCLQRWMDIKMECPTCRRSLPPA